MVFRWVLDFGFWILRVGGIYEILDQFFHEKMKNGIYGYRTSIEIHQGGPNPGHLQVGRTES
jgi:hypothetical protein